MPAYSDLNRSPAQLGAYSPHLPSSLDCPGGLSCCGTAITAALSLDHATSPIMPLPALQDGCTSGLSPLSDTADHGCALPGLFLLSAKDLL